MSDVTNYYVCTGCRKPCVTVYQWPAPPPNSGHYMTLSHCCKAPVQVKSSQG